MSFASRDPQPLSKLAVIDQTTITDIASLLPPFSDYFLPSKDQLGLMRSELYLYSLGSFADTFYYWSSTETASDTAWSQVFDSGGSGGNGYKVSTRHVRACRAFTTTTVYNIRDIGPAGGYIFWKSGNDYLEAAPTDQNTSQAWSNITNVAIGATAQGTGIGDGQSNTTAIIGQSSHTDSAAKLCNDLIIGGSISGKVDKVVGKSLVDDTVIDYLTSAPKITVGTTPPATPAVNDLWIDTN
jgi:hypothetical protein